MSDLWILPIFPGLVIYVMLGFGVAAISKEMMYNRRKREGARQRAEFERKRAERRDRVVP